LHTKAINGINPPIMIGERENVTKMKLVGLHSVLPRRNADNDSGKFDTLTICVMIESKFVASPHGFSLAQSLHQKACVCAFVLAVIKI
jgi:hypothetical protein